MLKITEVIPRTPNVKSFRFAIQGGPEYKAGQFLCAHLLTENPCKRYLSLSSSPTEEGFIEFTKKITQSEFSVYLDKAKPQDELKIEYPFGRFTLEARDKKIAFLSGGIGITPIRSMCRYIVDTNSGQDVILFYANRSIKDVAFKDEFEAMQKEYAQLKVVHVLCEVAPGFACVVGQINAQIVKDAAPDYLERKFYLCGPPAMVEAMQNMLKKDLGVSAGSIVTENFQGY